MPRYSSTSPLPSLRHDINAYEVLPGIIRLVDELGYTDAMVHVPIELIELMLEMDGRRSVDDLLSIHRQAPQGTSVEKLLGMIETLDDEGFLESESFARRRARIHDEYNALPVRPAMFAGSSYPNDPVTLRAFIDDCLRDGAAAAGESAESSAVPFGIIVPHLDPSLCGKTYGAAYHAIRKSDADTFIILGVPHRMSYDRFIFSRMDFETPIGRLETDRAFIDHFRAGLTTPLTSDEIAHMPEHSIEFQTIFLRHLFNDRPIRIVPILAGSLYNYVESGLGGADRDEALSELYGKLTETATALGRKVCWIVSVDFCHVGRKFDDPVAASTLFEEVRAHDMAMVAETIEGDAEGFLAGLTAVRNRYRVCGVAPMYAFLRAAAPVRGTLLSYDIWDESEQESAVSYGAVAFHTENA